MKIISIKNLKKNYGSNHVLKDIDIDIEEGEVVVIVGSSGSGKSTFLRCLNLLEEPTSGEIIVDGVKITDKKTDLNKLRREVGMVFQQFNLFPNYSVIENIKLAPKKLREVAEKGMTMVIVTHEMKFALEVGTRMIFLDKGVIIEDGKPSEVMDNPKTERARQFFSN